MSLYRHGDVLVQRVDALPGDVEKLPHRTLAHGELTGHAHRVDRGELLHSAAGLFLRLDEPASLHHEEHHTIDLEPGLYRVWRQREYSPEEIRTVYD